MIFARLPEEKGAEGSTKANSNQANRIKSGRDTIIIQGPITIGAASSAEARPLKQQVRDFLRGVNPEIIKALDSGQKSICVMLNIQNQPTLTELKRNPDLGSYLSVRSTGSVILGGSHNQIGGHLNDLNEVGMMNGFEFTFEDRLKLE